MICFHCTVSDSQKPTVHALHPGAIQGKEGIKFCYLATFIVNAATVLMRIRIMADCKKNQLLTQIQRISRV